MYRTKTVKVISLVLVTIFMAAVLLTGCGSKTEDKAAVASTAADASKADTAQAETTTASLPEANLIYYNIGTPQQDQKTVMDEFNKQLKSKINATVDLRTIDWGTYTDKMKIIIASNEPYDLCYTASWANDFSSNVAKGAFLPLDELLAKYGANITKTVPKDYFNGAKVNGKLYGITSYQIEATVKGYSVKKDLADKYKLDKSTIKKPQDLEAFFAAVKKGEAGITPWQGDGLSSALATYYFNNLETGYVLDALTSSGLNPLFIDLKANDFKVFNVLERKEALDYYKTVRDWYQKGYIRKDAASLKDFKAEQKSGKYAAFGAGALKPGNEAETKGWAGYDVVDVQLAPAFVSTTSLISSLTAISKNSKNADRAMMLIDLLYGDKDLYRLLCVGIENKHYKKIDENTIEAIGDGGYNPGIDWEWGNQFNMFLRKGQAPDTWAQTEKLNKEATVSPILGFNFDKEPVKTEIAQVEAIVGQYAPILGTGSADAEKVIAEANSKLKKAGIDKVIAEAQKQLDAWRQANGK